MFCYSIQPFAHAMCYTVYSPNSSLGEFLLEIDLSYKILRSVGKIYATWTTCGHHDFQNVCFCDTPLFSFTPLTHPRMIDMDILVCGIAVGYYWPGSTMFLQHSDGPGVIICIRSECVDILRPPVIRLTAFPRAGPLHESAPAYDVYGTSRGYRLVLAPSWSNND